MKDNYKKSTVYIGIPILCTIFIIVYGKQKNIINLLLDELILIFGYIASVYDIKFKKISNKLILIMLGTWGTLISLALFRDTQLIINIVKDALLGLVIGGGVFFLIYLISKKGLGGGDVKFIAATGLYVGFTEILSIILYGSTLAALTGLILIFSKKIGRKDTMPLVPFLYVGILIALFYG